MARFFHSRYAVCAAGALAVGGAIAYSILAGQSGPAGMSGIVERWSGPWPLGHWAGLSLGIAANGLIALLLVYLNKTFNVLRCMTMLQSTLFLVMAMATPWQLVTLTGGTVVALVAMACSFILFGEYGNAAECQRRVFLAMLLLSAGMAIDATFALLLPIFMLACAQMRILNLRTVLAMLMGIATPWILLLGFGIVSPGELAVPEFAGYSGLSGKTAMQTAIAAAATGFVGVAAWTQNLMKILTYKAQSRAMLSVLTLLMLAGVAGVAIDPSAAASLCPLLSCCCALQLGHVFGVVYDKRRSWIAIVCIIAIYLTFFAWTAILP